jgi:hypothetical protein
LINKYKSRVHNNTNHTINVKIWCDNEAVVNTINKFINGIPTLRNYYSPDFDVVDRIIQIRKKLTKLNNNLELQIKHVKGHQNMNDPKLTYQAKLNIQADKLATKSLNSKPNKKKIPEVYLAEATLTINNKQVTSQHSKIMRRIYHSIDIRKYLETANKWKGDTIDTIWWSAHYKAINRLNFGKRRIIQKFIHNRLPTNQRQHKYYVYKDASCKMCHQTTETQSHILQCTGCDSRNLIRRQYKKNLQAMLTNTMTTTETHQLITQNIHNWFTGAIAIDAKEIAPVSSSTLLMVSKQQTQIGWNQWFKGRLSITWGTLRNFEIQNIETQTKYSTAEKWAVDIITLTWEFVYDMWVERNKGEYDEKGNPTNRLKEKIIEIVRGESKKQNYAIYSEQQVEIDKLMEISIDNLNMMRMNLKPVSNA